MSSPRNQPQYQVRFEWGIEGADAIAPGSHIVVWADAHAGGDSDPLAITHDGAIITGSVGSREAVARWVLERQVELGDRAVVAVVAAGGPGGRFAVEDMLAAGAVIDALATVGIDFNSPEAAAACAAYEGLRNATLHLTSASETGQRVGTEALAGARAVNSESAVRVLREFSSGV